MEQSAGSFAFMPFLIVLLQKQDQQLLLEFKLVSIFIFLVVNHKTTFHFNQNE